MARETTRAEPGDDGARRKPYSRIRTFSSLESRDYRLLWVGNIFNHLALWLQLLTLGWLVWELTKDPETGEGSALLSATVAGLRAFPTLVIGPWAGVLVDRLDRRKLVIVVQVILAVVAVLFAFLVASTDLDSVPPSGPLRWWHAFVYAAFSAVGYAFLIPALQALLVNTVPPRHLGNALALNAMTVTGTRLVGALGGGILITTVGIQWNFFVEGAAYFIMAMLLVPMKVPYQEEATARLSSVMTNLKDGFWYIWRDNRLILHLMVLGLVLNLVFLPIPALLPAYTGGVLNAEANVGGYLMAAQGVGGFLATISIASLGFVIAKGKAGLIGLVVGSAALVALGQSNWLVLSMVMLAIHGFCQTNVIVSGQTLIQSMVPDALRGRVTSLYMLEYGLGPLAIFLTGLFMELYTVGGALTIIASAGVVVSMYVLITFRRVRQLD